MSYIQSNDIVKQPSFLAQNINQDQYLSAAQSGKIIILPANPATGQQQYVILPPAAPGLCYRFILGEDITKLVNITIHDDATYFGPLISNGGANATIISIVGEDTIAFSFNAVVGDWIEVMCDGVNWYCYGVSAVDDGIL